MDITDALAPTSDQLDAIELVNPRTFTIDTGSALGKREGKVVAEIRLVDFPRVWRPSKGMLDVLAACWGTDAKEWAGRSVTLYNDPDVMFGREKVGGIRISHLSHIDKARDVKIRATGGAGRKRMWHVEPLNAAPTVNRDETPRQAPLDLAGAFKAAGITDRDDRLRFVIETIGRDIASPADLTADEIAAVVVELTALAGGAA